MKQITTLPLALLTSCIFSQYTYAECISGDCINGQGIYSSEDGVKYTGQWKNGEMHGQGTYTYADGRIYAGLWKNGKLHGQSTYTAADGATFVGLWEEGKMNGHGTFTGANNATYVGQWKNTKYDGQGTFISANGNKYVGQWKDHAHHGQGTYTWSYGDVYTGQFKEGKRHGLATYTKADGGKYVGIWKHDKEHGKTTYYTRKGLIKNVTFENGKKIKSSLVLPSKAWFPKNAANPTFAGLYKKKDRESLSELYILEDNTFCYAFMGGSLDLMVAGTWQKNKQQKDSIVLKETKIDKDIHLAQGQQLNRLDNKISITINGYTLRDIDSPVFAVSQDDTLPTKFKPLLPKHNRTGRATYAFSLFSPAEAKYFYLGNIDTSGSNNMSQLQVTQYEIANNDTFQIAYDTRKSRLPQTFNAQFVLGKLLINGEPTDSKTELFPAMVKAVKKQCINPATQQQENEEQIGWVTLKPSNHFYLDTNMISNDPYFSKDDGDQARRLNGINELIEDEKKILALNYEKAKKDLSAYNELLVVSKELLQRENRKDIHIVDINLKLSQLLVDTLRVGEIKSAKEQFNAYATQIHPFIKDSTNRQAQYSILVMASQGAIIYGATRDKTVFTTIFDTLLGGEFDIETTTNSTLAYNLACIYSLTKNKAEMLKAITAARKMNKKPEQFLKDGDFAFYLNDSDFLATIQ